MDTMAAWAMGQANAGKPLMVFDWKKAAEIIRDERPSEVEAGLAGDWGRTGGVIFSGGRIVDDSYTYLASGYESAHVEIVITQLDT